MSKKDIPSKAPLLKDDEDLKEMIEEEKCLREELGADDENVKKISRMIAEIKQVYQKLGHLYEELELVEKEEKSFKPFKKIKFKSGTKSIISVLQPYKIYHLKISLKYVTEDGIHHRVDEDIVQMIKEGAINLIASRFYNWGLKFDVKKVYEDTCFGTTILGNKSVFPDVEIKEITCKEFPQFMKWGYLSPEFHSIIGDKSPK